MNMYFDSNYWNMFYDGEEDNYEWYNSWEEISKNLALKINPDSHILHIGCGCSTLGQDLFDSGIKSVINLDFSESCIKKMRVKYPHLNYVLLNALDISREFPADSFDLVVDKGCLDSILCDENYQEKVQQLLSGIYETLKDTGSLLVISVGSPADRLIYFNKEMWEIEVVKLEKPGIDILNNFENEEGTETISDMRYYYSYLCGKRVVEHTERHA